ncbi:DUF4249 domain-containing protein [Tellurirhabdus bombi]|uniref:DUF4249 domain-containing protein n=1 Tax=Tellurirhabdus bombi TaxID=2907205 RepID=UPI001F4117D2|nr:DUF4249 domain-containing protein [Tellurirhabdus bombi]
MMTSPLKRYLIGLLILAVGSCIEPYRPPAITAPNSYLVVDGFLNGGPEGTSIKLSRTRNLSEVFSLSPEGKAVIQVESERANILRFTETAAGTYTLNTPLTIGENYRLRIRTAGGKEYLSDYVPLKRTPAIDSVSWTPRNNGVQIEVTSHDPESKTRYYRWDYQDTYELRSAYDYRIEFRNDEFVYRDQNSPETYRCWKSGSSTTINVASSAKLSQDVIFKHPILLVSNNTPQLYIKYSILVKQYALTREAFEYWDNLRKSTEQLGSLFDPQPSQLASNIHAVTDPTEPVVGYLSANTVSEKRIFINRNELPGWRIPSGNEQCTIDTIQGKDTKDYAKGGYAPIGTIEDMPYFPGSPLLMAFRPCVDCRMKGSNVRPSFWQ